MVIKKLVLSVMQTNCYFVIKNNECLIIDPACDSEKILEFAQQNNLKILAVLLTHGHFDHVGACKNLQEKGIPSYISKYDGETLLTEPKMLGLRPSMFFSPDYFLNDKDVLQISSFKVECLLTSGHTKGSMCFLIEDNLFCGDTIFADGGYGRTDLFSGNFEELKNSIKNKIFCLNENTKLYCGHGKESDIKTEKALLTDF